MRPFVRSGDGWLKSKMDLKTIVWCGVELTCLVG